MGRCLNNFKEPFSLDFGCEVVVDLAIQRSRTVVGNLPLGKGNWAHMPGWEAES